MSDDKTSTTESTESSDLTNLKAEMDRKQGNTEAQLTELKTTNDQLLKQLQTITDNQQSQITKQVEAAKSKDSEDFSQLIYDNPQKYADIIQQRAEEKVMAKIAQSNAAQQKQTNVLSQLVSDYPELSDANNNLTKRAVELHGTMPEDERNHPLSYKVAVKDAAAEQGIKPRSQRTPTENDSFTLSSDSGTKTRQSGGMTDEGIFKVAEAFGMDINNEDVKARLKKRAERTNWNKYR